VKTSTLILLVAGIAALYFFVLKPKAAAVPSTLPRVAPPKQSMGEQTIDTLIKNGPDLIGDVIGGLWGNTGTED
jgi:hypothetical protein